MSNSDLLYPIWYTSQGPDAQSVWVGNFGEVLSIGPGQSFRTFELESLLESYIY